MKKTAVLLYLLSIVLGITLAQRCYELPSAEKDKAVLNAVDPSEVGFGDLQTIESKILVNYAMIGEDRVCSKECHLHARFSYDLFFDSILPESCSGFKTPLDSRIALEMFHQITT